MSLPLLIPESHYVIFIGRLDDHSAGNSRLLVLAGRVTVGLMWFQSREGRAAVVFEVHSVVYATTTVNFCLQRDCLATIRLKLCSVTLALVITKTSKSAARVQEAIKYLQRKQVTLIICNILPGFDFLFLFRLSKNIYYSKCYGILGPITHS